MLSRSRPRELSDSQPTNHSKFGHRNCVVFARGRGRFLHLPRRARARTHHGCSVRFRRSDAVNNVSGSGRAGRRGPASISVARPTAAAEAPFPDSRFARRPNSSISCAWLKPTGCLESLWYPPMLSQADHYWPPMIHTNLRMHVHVPHR